VQGAGLSQGLWTMMVTYQALLLLLLVRGRFEECPSPSPSPCRNMKEASYLLLFIFAITNEFLVAN
jgi:hypothetical protein